MKTKVQTIICKSVAALAAGIAAAMLLAGSANVAFAQPQPLPPGVQDVVKLAQAGLSDDVILTQIRNSGATYNLTTDQIILLTKEGVSQTVIKALMSGPAAVAAPAPAAPTAPAPAPAPVAAPAPSPVPAASAPADAAPTLDTFQPQLAPYGNWIQVPGYGLCWQPTVAVTDPTWRPYFDQGHWIYTDAGWSWESDYPWGGIAFHYGRWCLFNGGWVWVPGYDYAPAWVCWRESDGYCGWAPLPPGAEYRVGVGLFYGGRPAVDVDFGLGVDAFTFVGYDHFWDHDLRPFHMPHDRVVVFFHGSHILNGYRMDHGRFVVEGLGHDHIALVTHHEVRVEVSLHGIHDVVHPAGRAVIDIHARDTRAGHNDRNDDHHDSHDSRGGHGW